MELFCILVRSVSYLQVLQDLLVLSAAMMLNNVAAVNAQSVSGGMSLFSGL